MHFKNTGEARYCILTYYFIICFHYPKQVCWNHIVSMTRKLSNGSMSIFFKLLMFSIFYTYNNYILQVPTKDKTLVTRSVGCFILFRILISFYRMTFLLLFILIELLYKQCDGLILNHRTGSGMYFLFLFLFNNN